MFGFRLSFYIFHSQINEPLGKVHSEWELWRAADQQEHERNAKRHVTNEPIERCVGCDVQPCT